MTTPIDFTGARSAPPAGPRRVLLASLMAVVVAVVALPRLITMATDWWWYSEIGFQQVFVTSLTWRIALFFIGAIVAFGIVYGNVRLVVRGQARAPVFTVNQGSTVQVDLAAVIPRVMLAGSTLIAVLVGASTSAMWLTFLRAFHGVEAGTTDPLFGRDVGFYLFTLPATSLVLNTLVALVGLTLAACVLLYGMRGEISLPPQRIWAGPAAGRHVGILVAALFILVGVRLWVVGTADLLHSTTGPLMGASYTDVHVRLPAIRVSAIAAIAGAGLVLVGALRGNLVRPLMMAILAYAVIGGLGRGLFPYAWERLVVAPNQLARETPYLANHIDATRKAWGLDSVVIRDLSGDAQLTMDDIVANAATIENVRLWERELVKQTFSQLQEIRTYYDFVSITDDRYVIDGRYRQVHVSARELNTTALRTRTFINEHLTYTHGMGITMAPVNQVTAEGLPVLFVKDLPPVSTTSLTLTRPQIYYGELTNNFVFVGTEQDEFDYPSGESDVQTRYSGSGGVAVGSILRRALYAWQFGSAKILLSADISDSARVLYRRNIRERATTALPFLEFDAEPYLIISDAGELKWMLDGYTSSAHYPYAQRTTGGTNYLRNSVKVVIDAYDGSVDAYIAEPNDPIIRTYASIFGDVLTPMTEMPDDIRRHVRYPGELFRVQALLQAAYHMTQPETFYRREDQWQFPTELGMGQPTNPFMRHIILRLPGEPQPEFIYMVPFTPSGKDNLAAWMVARMDGDNYGQLVVYRFPKQSLVFGPRQVANRISQDTEISRQLTLWDQSGSQVIRGELLVIPVEESLIYVQPIFTRAEGGTIPELKRVVVAHGNSVVMGESLEQGLGVLFGGGAAAAQLPTSVVGATAPVGATTAPPATDAMSDLLRRARAHYERAISAQRSGDWTTYGREIELLGRVLGEIGSS